MSRLILLGKSFAFLIFLVAIPVAIGQQKPASDWEALQFLQGKWAGEGSSELGQGSGYFSFEPDLQKKIWVRRNLSEYPATKDRPKYIHEDLMIIYFEQGPGKVRAFYCDSEGHVINYNVAFSNQGNIVTFLSERLETAPRYRLSYVRGEPGHLTVTLEIAQPGKPDEFQKIVEGKVHRVTP